MSKVSEKGQKRHSNPEYPKCPKKGVYQGSMRGGCPASVRRAIGRMGSALGYGNRGVLRVAEAAVIRHAVEDADAAPHLPPPSNAVRDNWRRSTSIGGPLCGARLTRLAAARPLLASIVEYLVDGVWPHAEGRCCPLPLWP